MNLPPESGQAVIVHVLDEWAKVASATTGTSEASLRATPRFGVPAQIDLPGSGIGFSG